MAKRATKKATKSKAVGGFDMASLSKGAIRKLNALQKSVGEAIGLEAFEKWWKAQPAKGSPGDEHAAKIIELLEPLALKGTLKFPKGGYTIKRGKGRLIVEAASDR